MSIDGLTELGRGVTKSLQRIATQQQKATSLFYIFRKILLDAYLVLVTITS